MSFEELSEAIVGALKNIKRAEGLIQRYKQLYGGKNDISFPGAYIVWLKTIRDEIPDVMHDLVKSRATLIKYISKYNKKYNPPEGQKILEGQKISASSEVNRIQKLELELVKIRNKLIVQLKGV